MPPRSTSPNAFLAPHRPSAFTLVELLVVIGIIALLISILLPVLGAVRERGRRTQCLSNLRQIHLTMMVYAEQHKQRVPLGYRNGQMQFNSMIYSGTAGKFVLFGLLYQRELLRDPALLFCPSEVDERSMYSTTLNPWPPGPAGDPTKNVSTGYALRPLIDIPDDPALYGDLIFPRLDQLANKAILSDLMGLPARIDTRHKDGINVFYANGSAKWVARSTFNNDLKPCTSINASFNPNQTAIWDALDRE